jgi:hypothetical protein
MADRQTPFESIESAHEYVTLLVSQVDGVKATVADDFGGATEETAGRRLDALRLVDYKLAQLKHHLAAACTILNDLRALRRLLLGERDSAVLQTIGAPTPPRQAPMPETPAPQPRKRGRFFDDRRAGAFNEA